MSQLIKQKNFAEAREIKEDLEKKEAEEEKEQREKYLASIDRRKHQFFKRQKTEYQNLKSKIERTVNYRLKQRVEEYEILIQKIQNIQNELIAKQSLQFSKILSQNSKILSKFGLNLKNLENRYNSLLIR